jgi:hypothetical protein
MEEASFVILRKAMNLFQVSDHEVYFVNHLSGYEHDVKGRRTTQR